MDDAWIIIVMVRRWILFLLFSLCLCEQTSIDFQIRKRSARSAQSVAVGRLRVLIHETARVMEGEVEGYQAELVTEADFEEGSPVVVEFIALRATSPSYADRQFATALDQINSLPHGQKIVLVAAADPSHLALAAINYVQTRDRVGELYTEVLYPQEDLSPHFNYVSAPPKGQQEEESFFSRYKWPLIIGGVLLFTMSSSASPEQGQQGAARS